MKTEEKRVRRNQEKKSVEVIGNRKRRRIEE